MSDEATNVEPETVQVPDAAPVVVRMPNIAPGARPMETFPWDKLPEETNEAFLAFAYYRDMRPPRSVRKAWVELNPAANKANGTWFNWSARYKWVERCEAFDRWKKEIEREALRRQQATEAERLAENQRVFRDGLAYLAEQAMQKASEILAMPTVRDSFTEQRDGKLIIHKPTLLSPAYMMAAAALMGAAAKIGWQALGIRDEDGQSMTADQFRKLFYKNTGELPKAFPAGALPAPVDNSAVRPDLSIPQGHEQAAAAPPGQRIPVEVHRYKPPRERP